MEPPNRERPAGAPDFARRSRTRAAGVGTPTRLRVEVVPPSISAVCFDEERGIAPEH
jgi:hypothetical protein